MVQTKRQQGAALITALVCLILVSMMGVLSMRSANISSKISANAKQSAQALRMAESALSAFFINPAALWNLETVAGPPAVMGSAQLGNVTVPLQAVYTNDGPCSIFKGQHAEDGVTNGGGCVYLRTTSHYEVNALTDATASAGFQVVLKPTN
jgi:type II secretory pathway pseudopilin PulG